MICQYSFYLCVVCVWMFLSMYVCDLSLSLCMCIKAKGQYWASPLITAYLISYFLRQVPLMNLELDYRHMWPQQAFFIGVGNQNLGPQACMAHTLSTEPSSYLQLCFFVVVCLFVYEGVHIFFLFETASLEAQASLDSVYSPEWP